MIIKSKITFKVIALLPCLLFVLSLNGSSIQAGTVVSPIEPSVEEQAIILATADFLDDMRIICVMFTPRQR